MFQNVNQPIIGSKYPEERESLILYNEGQKIFSVFHKPSNLKKYPAVLCCHGLAGHKIGRYRAYVLLAEALATLGIACLRFDFRGSGDSEGAFHDMTLHGEVSDARIALKYLEEHPEVDSQRIGFFGRSMGSAIAILAATHFQPIKSLCLWAPVFHGHDWLGQWKKAQSHQIHSKEYKEILTIEGQTPGAQFFKEFFDMRLDKELDRLKSVPMMLIHGHKDSIVPADHSKKYLEHRIGAEGETKFIELPQSDHHFTNIVERELALDETCKWFLETLK
jgi:alpha-beta hydrolase superfamily lysophospholipase